MDAPGMVPKADDAKPASFSAEPQDGTSEPGSNSKAANGVAKATEYGACDPSVGGSIEAENGNDQKISEVSELNPASLAIATATE